MKKITNGTTPRIGILTTDKLKLSSGRGEIQVWATQAICDNPGENEKPRIVNIQFSNAAYDLETNPTWDAIATAIFDEVIPQAGVLPADGTWVVV